MSSVGIKLIDIPFAKGLEEFASRDSCSAEELALYGGEEYEIVGTVDKRYLREAKSKARSLGGELHVIGETMATGTKGVALPDGRKVKRDGWIHFRSEP
jgi:thiamine monophosphate kinase